jgi:phospholipid/cholesterol/gamma-HCH transport system substrate-binding protein
VLAVIWLGMSRFLEKGKYYATYFNESVQGLDVDSPVKYRGVSIGRVEKIEVAPDSKLIKVVLKIEADIALGAGIVSQLKTVGITGSMFVELDRKKKGEPDRSPPLSFPSDYPIVASKPSDISEILQGIDDVLSKMRALDVEAISEKSKGILDRIDQSFTDANVKGLSRSIEASLRGISRILESERWERIISSVEDTAQSMNALIEKGHKTVDVATQGLERVDGIIVSNQDTINTALDDFGKAMENANALLERGASFVRGTDDTLGYLRQNLAVTAQNLEKASENLDHLIELLAEHPSLLLFGEPPLPRKLERERNQRE